MTADTPTILVTDAARRAILEAAGTPTATLRIGISDAFEYDLRLDAARPDDLVVTTGEVSVVVDAAGSARAAGMTLDYEPGGGFTIDNPNVPAQIRQISPEELSAMLASGESLELIDVRTPDERAIARIDASRLLDQALHDQLMALDRNTLLVFQCHHGVRSQSAAEYFRQAGFRRICNLSGGIDAWSTRVDPSVARY